MKRLVLVLLLALPASAADVEVGIRHVVMTATGETAGLDLPMSRGFAATAEVFWTERLSTQFAASFVNPEASFEDVDLGTLGLDIYSVTARWHIAPASRLSGYAGAGAALVSIGNLDDQFGDEVLVEYGNETTFMAEAGLRYRLLPRLFVELGASYLPLSADGEIELNVDPLVIGGGVAWRF